MNNRANFESNIFESFKGGEQTAFTYFYDKYFDQIKYFNIQFVHHQEEAENVAQEAFLNLWQNRENIETINGIPSFLYTSAKSKCLNLIRHNKVKDRFKDDLLNQKERALDTEILNAIEFDTLEISELESIINKSIDDLPPKTKAVFIKKRFENKKNAEIAMEMQVSLKAVEAHMTKALKVLKSKLGNYLYLVFILICNN